VRGLGGLGGGVSGRGSAPSVFDIWVKPEVDPPMGGARCRAGVFHGRDDRAPLFCAARGSCKWEVNRPRGTHFSTAN
jgi:hypothetical protein